MFLQDKLFFADLRLHIGHHIVCVRYGKDGEPPANISLECEDCGCVLVDVEEGEDGD